MKKTFASILGIGCVLLATSASAAIITNPVNALLPPNGGLDLSIDGDAIFDLATAEDCCDPDNTFIYLFGYPTSVVRSWLSVGDVIDGSLNWEGDFSGYMPLGGQVVGLNYIAARNTSIGNYYGYITLDYTAGGDLYLKSYTYDDTGAALTVGGEAVPEPESLALLGLGLAGLGFARKKKAA